MRLATLHATLLAWFLYGQADLYFSPVFDVTPITSGIESITESDLQAHLTFLASQATEGRGTGQHGLQVAAEYIAAHFRRLNLTSLVPDGSFFLTYELLKTTLGDDPGLALLYEEGDGWVREEFQYGEDFFVSPRGLVASIEVQAPVVYAGYGITATEYDYDDYAPVDVEHKIVLAMDGERGEKDTHYSDVREKVNQARARGAAALLIAPDPRSHEIFSQKYKRWSRWLSRESMVLPSSERPVPVFFINSRVADRILAGIQTTLTDLQLDLEETGNPNSVPVGDRRIQFDVDIHKESLVAQNVVAYYPGSDPRVGHETVVISAHYDHLGKNEEGTVWPGADDNGSGTAALMEIAEAVALNPEPPRRGFLFLAVSGEEKGLLGSRYYVSHPVIPLDNTVADLNIDMVGRNAPDSIYVIGSDMISHDLHAINEFAATKIEGLYLNYRYNSVDDPNRFYYRSDHYQFASRDIPVIFFFAGVHEDYHKPTDTVDKINFAKLTKVARLVYVTAWGVAQTPVRPRKNAGAYPELPDQVKD
ncbi:MAG: M28 family peptidase [Fidelibacterota bacterium]